MKLSSNSFLIILLLLGSCHILFAQANENHVYLVGNAASTKSDWVDPLIDKINESNIESSVFFLGDITDKDGILKKPKKKNKKRLKDYKKIKKETKADIYFLSGDRDWDNSGPNGKQKVKNLEEFIEKDLKMKKSFIPSNACPGPYIVKENKEQVIVAINSQWFMHPHTRPEAPDVDCHIIYENDFWEELQDILDDAEERSVLLLAHHPIYSYGNHNGRGFGKYHLIPIIGSLYSSYRKNIGHSSDMASPRYQNYIHRLRGLLADHNDIIYASGHDFYNMIMEYENNVYINVSISDENSNFSKNDYVIHSERKPSLLRLTYNGSVVTKATMLTLDKGQLLTTEIKSMPSSFAQKVRTNDATEDSDASDKSNYSTQVIEAIAGSEYGANALTKKWMGENYRKEWLAPIKTSFLNLSEQHGGLRPYAMGGGRQTVSLKLKGDDGQRYAFRAVDKSPDRALDELLRQTIYREIRRQMVTTQHPYGGLVASKLLDHTDILHAQPTVFQMPDDPKLGVFRKDFANMLGFLEIKPKTKKKKENTFGGADAIVSSHQMLRAMYKSHDHRMDHLAYAKARVFDMWIGDWDKHEDNWKWARYDKKKKHTYFPIPRDRDHVFSKWEGIIPRISDKVIPSVENFGHEFDNVRQLNFQASFLDRRFGVELTQHDWLEAADYLAIQMTNEVIEEALAQLPDGLGDKRTKEIKEKLISRRGYLKKAVSDYVKILHEEINIIGSNQSEHIVLDRLSSGDVNVKIYDLSKKGKTKKLIYERTVQKSVTKFIYVYSLGGKDIIDINGHVDQSIKIRIVPGKNKDKINDLSSVKGWSKMTQIYQNKKEKDDIVLSDETTIKQPFDPAVYDYHRYQLNSLIPLPQIQFNRYNGTGITLGFQHKKQGFNKPDFAQKSTVKLKYFSRIISLRLNADYVFKHAYKDWDFHASLLASNQYDKYPYFFDLGSDSEIDDDLDEDDYYRIDFDAFQIDFGLQKTFLSQSYLGFHLRQQYNEVEAVTEHLSVFQDAKWDDLFGRGSNHSTILEGDLSLDFRDNTHAPYTGSLMDLNYQIINSFSYNAVGSRVSAKFSHYKTLQLGIPVTLIGRIGTINSFGKLPFYQRSIIGHKNFMRGFERNRFIGNNAAYANIESRLELFTWYNIIAPVSIGIIGFADRGSAWSDFSEYKNTRWRNSFGFGAFMAPLKRDYSFSFTYAINDEDNTFVDLSFGFNLD